MQSESAERTSDTVHGRETPRIYVASLSDYNEGRLHGCWIDADQEPEQVHAEIEAMLKASSAVLAEEWAIHDFEGFGGWKPGEFAGIEMVTTIARRIAEHGEIFGRLLDHCGDLDEAVRYIEDGYRGAFDSVAEYVEQFIDDVYGHELRGLPELLRSHIDYEGIARDFEFSGDIFTIEIGRTVHIFDSNF